MASMLAGPLAKKKRLEEAPEVISKGTTARSIAVASAAAERAKKRDVLSSSGAVPDSDAVEAPAALLDLSALPSDDLHRYLVAHRLLPDPPLTYRASIFPTPPLSADLDDDARRIVAGKARRAKQARNDAKSVGRLMAAASPPTSAGPSSTLPTTSAAAAATATAMGAGPTTTTGPGEGHEGQRRRRKRGEEDEEWGEVTARELTHLTAFDDANVVLGDRLASTARDHWDSTTEDARDADLIAGFVYAIRNRGKVLQ